MKLKIGQQRFTSPGFILWWAICLSVVSFELSSCKSWLLTSNVFAQEIVDAPDRSFVFIEDQDKQKQKKLKVRTTKINEKRQRLLARKNANLPFDINARSIDYDSMAKIVKASGGVIIGYPTGVLEAEEAEFNTETGDAVIKGDVRIDDFAAEILADQAKFNLKTGLGTMQNTKVNFFDGGYQFEADHVEKLEGEAFSFRDVSLTTCDCPGGDSCLPWRISGSSATVTRNGYGSVWNGVMKTCGVPVMYTPYMFFPVKTERQSGLLPMEFGQGQKSGFRMKIPYYQVLGNSADATLSAIYEEKVRDGVSLDYRGLYGRRHKLDFGGAYLNESQRNGALLGTKTDDLFDPTLDENRLAGYLDYYYSSSLGKVPVQVLGTGQYVSDDLILREFDIEQMGDGSSRYATSEALLRLMPIDNWSTEISSEFNQALVSDDDLVFQRLPSGALRGYELFRPFGENSYGLKLLSQTVASGTNYDREEFYKGTKGEIYQTMKVPYYFGNYIEGNISGDVRATKYELDNNVIPGNADNPEVLPDSSDRLLPGFSSRVSTTVEKVFDVGSYNPIKWLADLGPAARKRELARVKHSVQPVLKYRYVPEVDQDDNPQFDSYDRLDERNVVTASLVQRILGRFEPRNQYLFGIEEAAPDVEDVGFLGGNEPISSGLSAGGAKNFGSTEYSARSANAPQELANFIVSQSYDINENITNSEDEDEEGVPWSDLNLAVALLPNSHFRFGAGMDYNYDKQSPSDYNTRVQLIDKRGDELRGRFIFNDESVRQFEGSIQIYLLEGAKLGYYSRYDDLNQEFIESRVGLRLSGDCKCWILDLDVHDQINPDETRYNIKLTLLGLGSLGNTLFTERRSTLSGE